MTACAALSPGHCRVQVESALQLTPHDALSQRTRQVEPVHATVLESPVRTTSQVEPSRQLTVALAPAVKSHVEATHSGLALGPATTSQLAPPVQFASHEVPQVAAHEAAVQSRLQPAPVHAATLVQPQVPVAIPAHAQLPPEQAH